MHTNRQIFVCSLTGFTHCLWVMSPRDSLKLLCEHRCYQRSWFNTCGRTSTRQMMDKHDYGLQSLRGKVEELDGEMLLNRMMFSSLTSDFFGRFFSSFLTAKRTNLIFINRTAKMHILIWNFSGALGTWVALEWKQIIFIRTSCVRIYVVILAAVEIPTDWINFQLSTESQIAAKDILPTHGCLKRCTRATESHTSKGHSIENMAQWKGQGMHAVEPLKLNKYVALNCQTHEALIFKLSSTREKPETGFSWKKALPALMHLPWSSSVFVCQHPLERVCTVVFTKAVCHFGTQCYLQKALLLLTWKIYIWGSVV